MWPGGTDTGERIITVSIAPFKYFVKQSEVMISLLMSWFLPVQILIFMNLFPKQIFNLRKSVGYISNGYLGFEITWLDRFYDTNRTMKKLSLGKNIDPLVSDHHHEGDHVEGADPHYWVSPKCALIMASSVRDFLCELNPSRKVNMKTIIRNFYTANTGA